MSISLIPRCKVNYSFRDYLCSIFISEKKNTYTKKARKLLSDFFENRPVFLTSSARSSLYFILISERRKKVIVSAYTCPVVIEAIKFAHKEIVYVGVDDDSFNTNCFDIADSDSIVIATHQFGYPCDIERIREKCDEVGALLIEDCAAAIGTTVNGRNVGTFGDYSIVSFNHTKQMMIPRGGGCLIARSQELLDHVIGNIRLLKNSKRTYKNKKFALKFLLMRNPIIYKILFFSFTQRCGINNNTTIAQFSQKMDECYFYDMDEWQAYLLCKQIERMPNDILKRRKLFNYYDSKIINPFIKKPPKKEYVDYAKYCILIDKISKYKFADKCFNQGVDLEFSHSTIGTPVSFLKEHRLASEILNLPFYPNLSAGEAEKVIQVINNIS